MWKIRKGAITGAVRESDVDPVFMEYGRVGLRERSMLFRGYLEAKRGDTRMKRVIYIFYCMYSALDKNQTSQIIPKHIRFVHLNASLAQINFFNIQYRAVIMIFFLKSRHKRHFIK